jgi:membrane-associated protease RseP (regulator of RpoE activity)
MQLFIFIVGLAALIPIHEFGHFIAARLLKVDSRRIWHRFPTAGETFRTQRHDFSELDLSGVFRPPQG